MDHFAKIASEQRKKLAAAVTIDFKVEDNAGNRVVLSTDGTITGYTNGKKTSWEPILNENQLSSLENGHGTRVAAELLKDYSSFVKTALLEVKERDGSRQEQLDEVRTGEGYDGQTRYDALKAHHKGVSNMTRGEEVATKHTGTDEVVREQLLADAGLYGHKAVHEEVTKSLSQLVSEVCKGAPTEILEKRLEKCRVGGDASAHEIVSATINALARTVVSARETPSYILKVAQMLSEDPKLPEMISAASTTGDMDAAKAEKAGFFGEETEASSPVTTLLKQLGSEVKDQEISPIDITDALAALVEEGEITKQGIKKLVEPMLKSQSVSPEGMDAAAEPSKIEKLKSALMSAIDQDEKIVDKAALQAGVSAAAQSASEMQVTPDEIAGTIDEMEDRELVAAIDEAKTVTATEARLRARSRREFWGLKTASSKDIKSNLVGWLADYSLNYDISTVKIATAAKKLCAQGEIAEKLIERAISVKLKNEKTAAMNVTQSKMECLRFVCTKDDLGGMNPSDDAFEDAFKQKAIEVLQQHNFTVDPATFSFTDLVVDGEGNVTASVSTNVSKTFNVDSEGHADMADDVEEVPVVMSDSARVARKNKRDQVLSKYAMAPGMGAPAGAPGTAPQAPPAGPVGDLAAGANMAGGDLGVSGFTGNEMGEAPKLDGIPNPEEKKPWGSVCPVCGSDDVDVAEGRSSCNSCSSVFESEYIIKLISDGKADKKVDEAAPEAPLEGDTGLGAATASNSKIMIRLSGTIDSDVYLKTASPTFNKEAEKMLPIGMVCPSCGNRKAHKVKDNTFCYDCGNYSKTRVAASKTDPSKLDVSITWIE